jgi:hypothetical protein
MRLTKLSLWSILALVLGSGCKAPPPATGVVKNLPDPVFPKWQPNPTTQYQPLAPAPAPAPKPPAPVKVAPKGDSKWKPPRGISKRWSCIVIHHSASAAGGAESFDKNHRDVRKW